jgi:metacaspase-1
MAKKTTTKGVATKRVARRGLSLHIGLNAVSPAHYEGWSGELNACEFDAKDMAAIAKAAGMRPTVVLTKNGTRKRVLTAMRAAAKQLKSGDFFFLTYSGHGGQIPDVTGEENDKLDETWCFFDAQLIDDELYLELTRFAAGVRILVLSDSCHSGTVTRARPVPVEGGARSKMMPPAVAIRTYTRHKAFYDDLQTAVERTSKAAASIDPDAALAHVTVSGRLTNLAKVCKASVILISGCQDNQTSMDGDHNGAFTEQLLKIWNHGSFKGNYTKFHAAVKAGMPRSQSPNLFTLGRAASFAAQRPFTL